MRPVARCSRAVARAPRRRRASRRCATRSSGSGTRVPLPEPGEAVEFGHQSAVRTADGEMMRAPFARGAIRVRRSVAILAAVCVAACGGDSAHDDDGPFRVAGTMSAAAGSATDSDTNDPNAPFARNDSAAQAQEIGIPVSLGGHVNCPGALPPCASSGATTSSGDLQDWFRVSIAAGQTIRLQLGEDGFTNNLDLDLRELDQSLVEGSATTGRVEELEVTDSGDYSVVVRCVAGFSNYTLTIGQQPTSASTGADEPEFVPGQVVVRYRDDLAR